MARDHTIGELPLRTSLAKFPSFAYAFPLRSSPPLLRSSFTELQTQPQKHLRSCLRDLLRSCLRKLTDTQMIDGNKLYSLNSEGLINRKLVYKY